MMQGEKREGIQQSTSVTNIIILLAIAFLVTYIVPYYAMRDSFDAIVMLGMIACVWMWATVFALIGYAPYYFKYRNRRKIRASRSHGERLDLSVVCYMAGFLLILLGCGTAAILQHWEAKFPMAGDIVVLISAVAGGALCSDAILGVTGGAGGKEIRFRADLALEVAIFLWLLFAMIALLCRELEGSVHGVAFSSSFLILCIISNFFLVHILNPELDGVSKKSNPLFFRGLSLIVIGGIFSVGYALGTDAGSFVNIFSKFFFASYTAAIGAALVARSCEWNESQSMDKFEAWQAIRRLSRDEFNEQIKYQKLSADRQDLLFKFIHGEIQVSYTCQPDIEAYALKALMPDVYRYLPHEAHPYSSSEHYEYDPAKNGQNIIKHGIGFGEVVSYSSQFGTLLVPCPDDRDGERCVVFSDLKLKRNDDKLELPPSGIREVNYTISVVQQKEGRFRFISARLMSSKREKYRKTMEQAFGEIFADAHAREGFVDHCVGIVEAYLIRTATM
ncbi:BrnT family toxin [Paraburkholderia sp. CNPSo 3076]|uniref:BrnT family toxin n=1 Tax=Paraburkholderia sp. CNPSo 3076 TaxID=2940936 RepID=UPI002258C9E1|nr:BrnT family toxin [Paraburkholderia sp. CNPSo 3076]MCX5545222.1 BrnT family toxin [Paraburkholderia sp. CNPSo 3076]